MTKSAKNQTSEALKYIFKPTGKGYGLFECKDPAGKLHQRRVLNSRPAPATVIFVKGVGHRDWTPLAWVSGDGASRMERSTAMFCDMKHDEFKEKRFDAVKQVSGIERLAEIGPKDRGDPSKVVDRKWIKVLGGLHWEDGMIEKRAKNDAKMAERKATEEAKLAKKDGNPKSKKSTPKKTSVSKLRAAKVKPTSGAKSVPSATAPKRVSKKSPK